MSATPRSQTVGASQSLENPELPTDARAPISRLRAIHEEAEETAHLANLLGRTLYAALTLTVGTVAVLALAGVSLTRGIAWAALMLFAILAVSRSYKHAIGAPFERAPLRAFAEDLSAILLYAGFAWGAGAILVVAQDGPLAVAAFSVGMALLLALSLRSARQLLHFLVPSALLGAAAPLFVPTRGALLCAAAVIGFSALIAAAVLFRGRTMSAGGGLPGASAA